MVHISAPITAAWLSAQDRALADRAAGRRPIPNGRGRYLVESASEPGVRHEVTVHNAGMLDASCTCVHGRQTGARGHCKHQASALMAELERVSRPPASDMAAKMARFSRAA